MSGPVLSYRAETAPHRRAVGRVVGWLAVACGVPFWAITFYTRTFRHHLPYGLVATAVALFMLGCVLGLIGTLRSRGRSRVAWMGLAINVAIIAFAIQFAYASSKSKPAKPRVSTQTTTPAQSHP